ncbi:hypothetical protein BV898_04964 [Hypsibius exemplaris]|uniref:BZIP domain-containing protein n=1 Tax=Hypsibius exemplaris TaxID=2072580 RepID=A0A1W0X190_HYPEX|nr:hypothetical protein BV898_04964 [Hypsibius exemplaris]
MERSRQSARECRARKKLRYDYLDDLVLDRERAVERLQAELKMYEEWCEQLDHGQVPRDLQKDPFQVAATAAGPSGISQAPLISQSQPLPQPQPAVIPGNAITHSPDSSLPPLDCGTSNHQHHHLHHPAVQRDAFRRDRLSPTASAASDAPAKSDTLRSY